MARRTWSFALVGALIVGATALIYENTLEFYGSCGSDGKTVCTGYRTEVFGILLSQTKPSCGRSSSAPRWVVSSAS